MLGSGFGEAQGNAQLLAAVARPVGGLERECFLDGEADGQAGELEGAGGGLDLGGDHACICIPFGTGASTIVSRSGLPTVRGMAPAEVSAVLAQALVDGGWTQYRLVKEAGFATSTARRLLGRDKPGTEASPEAMERAAALIGLKLVLRKKH